MPNDIYKGGFFVPTTNIWDISQLNELDVNSKEFKEFIVILYQNINNICLALNAKDTGLYILNEFVNSQTFFPINNTQQTRPVYRLIVDFGALPNATTKSVAHNIVIDGNFSFTRIYATSTKTDRTSFIPIPFSSSTLNENIKIEVTDTNVQITTAIDYSDYIVTYVVLEYLKE